MEHLKTNIWNLYLSDKKNVGFDEFPITKFQRPYIKRRKYHCEAGDKVFCLYEEGCYFIVKQSFPANNLIYVFDEINKQERAFFYDSVINIRDVMETLGVDEFGKKIKLINEESNFENGEYYFIIYKLKRKNTGSIYTIKNGSLKPTKQNNLKMFKDVNKIYRIKSIDNLDLFFNEYKHNEINKTNIIKLFHFKVLKG